MDLRDKNFNLALNLALRIFIIALFIFVNFFFLLFDHIDENGFRPITRNELITFVTQLPQSFWTNNYVLKKFRDKPIIDIPKVITALTAPLSPVRQIPELNGYHIIEDCRDPNNTSVDKNSLDPPSDDTVSEILREASLYKSFQIKVGYTLGRVRATGIQQHGPTLCFSHFRLGIRDDATGEVLAHTKILQGVVFTKDTLPLAGDLVYGKVINANYYRKIYENWSSKKNCGMNKPMVTCVRINEKWPEGISDGDITQESDDSVILHRFSLSGQSMDGMEFLYYHQIKIGSEGIATLDSKTLVEFDSGVTEIFYR